MNFSQFVKSLESPEAIYLVITDQEYLRKRVMQACIEKVSEEARTFDWGIFDLKEKDVSGVDITGVARTMPWMTQYRWVYVRNAHEDIEAFREYAEDPSPRTVLILEMVRKVAGLSKFPVVELKKGANTVGWVEKKLEDEGYLIESGAGELLVELVGEDYQRLELELEKLILWQLENRRVTRDAVLSLVTEARERDVFELIDAIAKGRQDSALRIYNRLLTSGIKPQQVISLLYWSFRRLIVAREELGRGAKFYDLVRSLKIWSFKGRERQVRSYPRAVLVEMALGLREVDRMSKSTNLNESQYLERLIIDTCRERSV